MMKFTAIISLLLVLLPINAQESSSLTYAEAIKLSSETGKMIVVQFSGSDWCAPCIRLEKQIVNTPEFEVFAKGFIWVKADFPRKKSNRLSKEITEQNDMLAEQFNSQGHFPLLVFLDKDQKVKGTIGYKSVDVKAYIAIIEKMIE